MLGPQSGFVFLNKTEQSRFGCKTTKETGGESLTPAEGGRQVLGAMSKETVVFPRSEEQGFAGADSESGALLRELPTPPLALPGRPQK